MHLPSQRLDPGEDLQLLLLHVEQGGPLQVRELVQPGVDRGDIEFGLAVDRIVGLRLFAILRGSVDSGSS